MLLLQKQMFGAEFGALNFGTTVTLPPVCDEEICSVKFYAFVITVLL